MSALWVKLKTLEQWYHLHCIYRITCDNQSYSRRVRYVPFSILSFEDEFVFCGVILLQVIDSQDVVFLHDVMILHTACSLNQLLSFFHPTSLYFIPWLILWWLAVRMWVFTWNVHRGIFQCTDSPADIIHTPTVLILGTWNEDKIKKQQLFSLNVFSQCFFLLQSLCKIGTKPPKTPISFKFFRFLWASKVVIFFWSQGG